MDSAIQYEIEKIEAIFSGYPRPNNFVPNPNHCEECFEINCKMQNKWFAGDEDLLIIMAEEDDTFSDLSRASNEFFLHLFPSLCRFFLTGNEFDFFLREILFRANIFSEKQRKGILDLLEFVKLNFFNLFPTSEDLDFELTREEISKISKALSQPSHRVKKWD